MENQVTEQAESTVKAGDSVTFQPSRKLERGESLLSGTVIKVFSIEDGSVYVRIKGETKNYVKRIDKVTKV